MITSLFLSFLEISLSVSLVILLMLLISPLLTRRYAAKWSYWIWIFLALRLVVPFRGAESAAAARIWRQTGQGDVSKAQENQKKALPGERTSDGIIFEIPPQMTEPMKARPGKTGIPIAPIDITALLWAFGSLAFLSVHLLSYFRFKNQVGKEGVILKNSALFHQLSRLRRELHIKPAVQVVVYADASSPMIAGFLKPVLILPEEPDISEELYFILKHELVHLKRRDVLAKLILTAARALHWYNPLVWLMQKEAVVEMELSCDEKVTQGTDLPLRKAYTEALLSAFHRGCTRKTYFSTEFYGGKQIMKKRFKNILRKTEKKNGMAVFVVIVMLTVVLGTTIGCSTAKEDISPEPEQTEREEDAPENQSQESEAEPSNIPVKEEQQVSDSPRDGQIYGYITEWNSNSLTIDRQIWATPESEDWKPEYDEDAGFEVADAPGGSITYAFHPECTYSALENHQNPAVDLTKEEFEAYLAEMEYPILWVIGLENGRIKTIQEQYRP